MAIDWFTVIAQAINFFILVWLMKRFLYRPIRNAIDQREKLIMKELNDAKELKTQATQTQIEFKLKSDDFAKQRAVLSQKMMAEVQIERDRLLDAAKKAANDELQRRIAELKSGQENLNHAIRKWVGTAVLNLSGKVLNDLAGKSLEDRVFAVFAEKLKALPEVEKNKIAATLKETSANGVVRTAGLCSSAQQTTIKSIIGEVFGPTTQTEFLVSPELICGIELTANDQKISWSVADYLRSLETDITAVVTHPTAESSAAAQQPKVERATTSERAV